MTVRHRRQYIVLVVATLLVVVLGAASIYRYGNIISLFSQTKVAAKPRATQKQLALTTVPSTAAAVVPVHNPVSIPGSTSNTPPSVSPQIPLTSPAVPQVAAVSAQESNQGAPVPQGVSSEQSQNQQLLGAPLSGLVHTLNGLLSGNKN